MSVTTDENNMRMTTVQDLLIKMHRMREQMEDQARVFGMQERARVNEIELLRKVTYR